MQDRSDPQFEMRLRAVNNLYEVTSDGKQRKVVDLFFLFKEYEIDCHPDHDQRFHQILQIYVVHKPAGQFNKDNDSKDQMQQKRGTVFHMRGLERCE